MKKLEIGGFLWDGTRKNEDWKALTDKEKEEENKNYDRKRFGLGIKYESNWTFRAEYMYSYGGGAKKTLPKHSEGWYATIGVPVAKDFKVYGKWDCYRNNTRTWASLTTNWCVSANYNLGKNLMMQLNYTFTDDRTPSATDKHFNTVDFQISARF